MREKYLKLRRENKNDVNFLYEVFIKMGGTLKPNDFMLGFSMFRNDVILGMDRYFNATTLHDAKGKFIKVI